MTQLTIPYAEIMVTQVCNLVCLGCSTYSDLQHKGYKSWNQGRKEIEPWLDRVNFDHIGIMGGEPLINPEIKQWLVGVRKLMPDTTIRVPTNATLLHKHLDVVDLLQELGNVIFKITVHQHDNPKVESAIEYVQNKFNWQPVYEYNVHRFVTDNNFKFQVNRPEKFFKTFNGEYHNAAPYNSEPDDAFEVCHQKECPLLLNNRIYKCSTSGLMDSVLARHGYPNHDLWKPYLDNGINGSIGIDESIESIKKFIDNIQKPHATCRQCPNKNNIQSINHPDTVFYRNKCN